MSFLLHLAILLFTISCKAEENQTYSTGFQHKASTNLNSPSNISGLNWLDTTNVTSSFKTASQSVNKDLYTPEYTKTTTAMLKMSPQPTKVTMGKMSPQPTKLTTMGKMAPQSTKRTTNRAQYTMTKITSRYANHSTSTPCVCKDDRYKTGIMICAVIIAVLVLICAALIICSVALANKVSSLKTKLTQSKRQARSNGDFLSASSILWPSGMETWQKRSQTANQTMDEISLGETIITDEKHTLMTVQTDKLKEPTEDIKTTSNDENMTTISTVEV